MNRLKQGMAAIASVALLGLVVPSTLGGSVSADITHNPNLILGDPFPFQCDVDGNSNGDTEYVADHYETTYTFVTTPHSQAWHDLNGSNTVMTGLERIGVPRVDYVVVATVPGGDPVGKFFTDDTVEWFDVFFAGDVYPHGKPKGLKPVRCINIAPAYDYTMPGNEAALDQEHRLTEGVTYSETDYQLYELKLSGSGKAKAKAHHSHEHHGKH